MTLDPRRKQKKLERKKAKRKEAVTKKRVPGIISRARDILTAVNSPIHECFVSKGLFDIGLGTVVISRAMPNGNFGVGFFLLDVYCLGAKNAHFTVATPDEYAYRLEKISVHEELENIHPACTRKLIEESIAYAKYLGFKPHSDYFIAKKIFGDIDSNTCPVKFEFGRDGKPFYASGPSDTPEKSRKIIDQLMKKCGPDGFNYISNIGEYSGE